jgi:hypothetical protein
MRRVTVARETNWCSGTGAIHQRGAAREDASFSPRPRSKFGYALGLRRRPVVASSALDRAPLGAAAIHWAV